MSDFALHLSISQAIFLGIAAIFFQRKTYIGKLIIGFSISMLGYFFYFLMDVQLGSIEGFILGRLSYAIPGIIWLLAYALFEDGKPVPRIVWLLIASYILLRAIGSAYYSFAPEGPSSRILFFLFFIVPQIINTGMYVHMLCLAVIEYRQDLIEARRRLRVAFVAVLGTFWLLVSIQVTITVLQRMGIDSLNPLGVFVELALNILVFPGVLAVNLMLFRVETINFGIVRSESGATPDRYVAEVIDPKDLALKDRLLKIMDDEQLYIQTGLTIGKLAHHMDVQEYRLRSVINRVLKHSNFSHFLSKYRIKKAEELLHRTDEPIFNIGLDIGYTSLSSFHKAFKECHGVTPKEYRVLVRQRETNDDGTNIRPLRPAAR